VLPFHQTKFGREKFTELQHIAFRGGFSGLGVYLTAALI